MSGNSKDLEFVLRFKNEAKQTLAAARQDLKSLGVEAANVSKQMRNFSGAGTTMATQMQNVANAASRAELQQKRLELQTARLGNETSLAAQKTVLAQKQVEMQEARLVIQANKLHQADASLMLGEQKLALSADRLALSQSRLSQQQAKYAANSQLTGRGVLGLATNFSTLFALVGGYSFVKLSDQYTLFKGRLDNATRSTAEFTQAYDGLLGIARETGTGLEASVSVFQRLSFVRDEINATVGDMLQFTETVSQLGVISGASSDALKFGLTQLGQSLSSNLVRAEEFNSIMENIPAVGVEIAKQLGVTTGQLRQLVINGKLLSEDVFTAILASAQQVQAQFDKFPQTIGRAFQGLLIDLQQSVGLINDATGASTGFIWILVKTGQTVRTLAASVAAMFNVFDMGFVFVNQGFKNMDSIIQRIVISATNARTSIANIFREDKPLQVFDSTEIDEYNKNAELALADLRAGWKDNMAEFNKSGGDLLGMKKEATNIQSASIEMEELKKKYQELAKSLGSGKEGKKAMSFYGDLARDIEMLKEETYWVGKSSKERERATKILKVQQDALKAGIKDFDPSQYMQALDELTAAQERVHTDFGAGLLDAMQQFKDNAKGMGDLAKDIFDTSVEGISGTLKGLVDGSITSFDDLRTNIGGILSDIAGMIAEFAIKQQLLAWTTGQSVSGGGGNILSGISSAVSSLFGIGAGRNGTFLPATAGSTLGQGITWNAKGNAFNGGSVVAFAKGGITDQMTKFPMPNGKTGMMGEAGPEAIMPLTRLADGSLGVGMSGAPGGGGNVISMPVNVTVTVQGGQQGNSDPEEAARMGRQIADSVKAEVYMILDKESRNGGRLSSTYNKGGIQ